MPDRNDPCPCGSGKKYKKCCGPQAQVISLVQTRYDRAYRTLLTDLEAYCMEFDEDDTDRARDQFFGTTPPEEEEDEESLYAFLDWFAFSYRTWQTGETVLEVFAGHRTEPAELELLEAWRASRSGLYTLAGTDGRTVLLQDILSGERFPTDFGAARAPGPDALVVGRLLPVGEQYRPGFDLHSGLANVAEPLRALAAVELERMQRAHPAATMADLLRQRWPVIHDLLSLAILQAEQGTRISLPPLRPERSGGHNVPPAGASAPYVAVAGAIAAYAANLGFTAVDAESAQRIWWDVAEAVGPRVTKPESWAAAVMYAWHRHIAMEDILQAKVAEAFDVAAPTVGKNYRQIVEALVLIDQDDRYVDPLDPLVRAARMVSALPREMAQAVSDPIWLFGAEHPAELEAAQEATREAHRLLGEGELKEARKRCEDALRHCPVFAPARNNMALAFMMEGKYKQAVEAAEPVLITHPEYLFTIALLAEAHYRAGQSARASARLDEALALYRRWLKERRDWVKAERQSDRHRLWEALAVMGRDHALCELARLDDPSDLSPHRLFQAAVAAQRTGNPVEARRWLEQARELDPESDLYDALLFALNLVSQGVLRSFQLDYDFSLDTVRSDAPQLSAAGRAVLLYDIWGKDEAQALEAVDFLAQASDPWAGETLKLVSMWPRLAEAVRKRAERALKAIGKG